MKTKPTKEPTFIRALKGNLWDKRTNVIVASMFALLLIGIGYIITSSYAAQPGSTLNGPLVSAFPSKCLDNNGDKRQDGNRVQMWDCNDTVGQNWLFRSDGTVHLNDSTYCLDVAQATKEAQLWTCNGASSQVWKATDDHTVINQVSGQCLDIKNANAANGNSVGLYNCNGTDAQKWYFNTPLDSAFAGKCLDNDGRKMVAGNKVQLWDCNNTLAQKWTFKHGGRIHMAGSDLCLEPQNRSKATTTTVQLGQCNEANFSQVWQFTADSHAIMNLEAGLCLDDRYSDTANGNVIWLWQCNGTNAQKWFAPVASSLPVVPTPPTTPNPPTTPTPPTTPPPTPPTTPNPNPDTTSPGTFNGQKLIFSDEFNGTTLNTAKWQMCNPSFNPGIQDTRNNICRTDYNNEQQVFRTNPTNNQNIKVGDGTLKLIATKEGGQIYSGMISSGPNRFGFDVPNYKPFSFTYGTVEWRAKFPKGKGFWPSFWMLPDQSNCAGQPACANWPYSGEYDIVEIPGDNPWQVIMTEHDGESGGNGDGITFYPADTSADFHKYRFEWQPGYLKWYFDDQLMKTFTKPVGIKNFPFYPIANFSLGGPNSWGGQNGPIHGGVNNTTPYPSSFVIDYVRIYK